MSGPIPNISQITVSPLAAIILSLSSFCLGFAFKLWRDKAQHKQEIAKRRIPQLSKFVIKYYIPYITFSEKIKKNIKNKANNNSELSFFDFALWLYFRHTWFEKIRTYFLFEC